MARVMAFARKTGDYAVLSQTDLGVVALTLQYEVQENGEVNVRKEPGEKKAAKGAAAAGVGSVGKAEPALFAASEGAEEVPVGEAAEESDAESVEVSEPVPEQTQASEPVADRSTSSEEAEEAAETAPIDQTDAQLSNTLESTHLTPSSSSSTPKDAAPAEESDPESDGEWITPSNLTKHRSKDLGLLPSTSPNAAQARLAAAAMTGDFAVQNVLLAMGLGLVGEGGKRIAKVKSWVLRCHACFK
jgi:RNA-binding protein NOB1